MEIAAADAAKAAFMQPSPKRSFPGGGDFSADEGSSPRPRKLVKTGCTGPAGAGPPCSASPKVPPLRVSTVDFGQVAMTLIGSSTHWLASLYEGLLHVQLANQPSPAQVSQPQASGLGSNTATGQVSPGAALLTTLIKERLLAAAAAAAAASRLRATPGNAGPRSGSIVRDQVKMPPGFDSPRLNTTAQTSAIPSIHPHLTRCPRPCRHIRSLLWRLQALPRSRI